MGAIAHEGEPMVIPEPRGNRFRPIRIVLADDHHLVREGLRLVLSRVEGFEVVGDAATQEDAVELVDATNPDVLLLDLTFPDGDGLPLLRALRARHRDLRVVVLTMHRESETVRQALAAGAAGYVVKGARSIRSSRPSPPSAGRAVRPQQRHCGHRRRFHPLAQRRRPDEPP